MKLAIVNDMPIAVEILRRFVTADGKHEIIWVAENGQIAVEKCAHKVPDLILMDLIMPVMNGVESTRWIMKLTPCPILLVTANVAGNSGLVFEAMGAGALDVVATPILDKDKGEGGQELLQKIDRIGKIVGINEPSVSQTLNQAKLKRPNLHDRGACLVAIGSSTGGPKALLNILQTIPAKSTASFVVIQHMDELFSRGMADWLDSQVNLKVRVLKEGELPQPGVVLIPSTNHHVIMYPNKSIGYSVEQKESFYHPSVDIFFNSVARYWRGRCIGIILTGMGRDGAEGLLALRQQGYVTIAQDQKSSVVFGMPKAAIEIDAAQKILALDAIGLTINELLAMER
ncbi:MAG: chemotaxis response regulator protein-glutamate methylesterase [Proteobacteria bacterium]|nr:chemotaxis response regulator protein-glutamate methylesterase [Pseudomonadota bacterium]MBU1058437.1 chemotaxis response regulator protein-glutamate methylesterase [Pseudomonadota bacterium]